MTQEDTTPFEAALDCVNQLIKDPTMESFRGRLHIAKGHLMDNRPLSTSLYFEFVPKHGVSNGDDAPTSEVIKKLEELQQLLAPCQLIQQKSYLDFMSISGILHDMYALDAGPYYNALTPKFVHPTAPKLPQQDQGTQLEHVTGCIQGLREISAHMDEQDAAQVEKIVQIHSRMIDSIVHGESITPLAPKGTYIPDTDNKHLHIFNAQLKEPLFHLCEGNLDNELLTDTLMTLHRAMSALIESQIPTITMPELQPEEKSPPAQENPIPSVVMSEDPSRIVSLDAIRSQRT